MFDKKEKEWDRPLSLFHNITGIFDVVCLLLQRKSQDFGLPHSICLELRIPGSHRPLGKSWSMYLTIFIRVLCQILASLCLFFFPLCPSWSLFHCQPLFKPQHFEGLVQRNVGFKFIPLGLRLRVSLVVLEVIYFWFWRDNKRNRSWFKGDCWLFN